MEIKQLCLGAFGTNTYILNNDDEVLLIDPASKAERLVGEFNNKKLVGILLTHGHLDHLKACDELYDLYRVPIFINEADEQLARDKTQGLSFGLKNSPYISRPLQYLKEGKMKISSFEFEVIFTPGHSPGSCCFLFEGALFSGDTLFHLSVGRCDLWGGSERDLKSSLRELRKLSPSLKLYPGHDELSELGFEFLHNSYF